ncbi:hypothetical protein TNCT_160841, partial [Trichonephila clavata]
MERGTLMAHKEMTFEDIIKENGTNENCKMLNLNPKTGDAISLSRKMQCLIRTTSEVISATCTCPAGGTPTFCKQ